MVGLVLQSSAIRCWCVLAIGYGGYVSVLVVELDMAHPVVDRVIYDLRSGKLT